MKKGKILVTFFSCCLINLFSYAATYVVSSTGNGTTVDGVSLRWAITQANSNAGADIISFNLGVGTSTITISSALPTLTDNGTTIDGFSNGANPGVPNSVAAFNTTIATPFNPTFRVVLLNAGGVANGIIISADNCVIQGIVFPNLGGAGSGATESAITIDGDFNQVLGCYVGMEETGTTATGTSNTDNGIIINGDNNSIGDGTAAGANLISGNSGGGNGIIISGLNNSLKGNIIGLKSDGKNCGYGSGQSQQSTGVRIKSSGANNSIGGVSPGEGNVISGNYGTGIEINTAGSGNMVLGNIIGPAADGMSAVTLVYGPGSNQGYGMRIFTTQNVIIGDGSVGGRNIISANGGGPATYEAGIFMTGNCSVTMKGNYIGIAKDGITFIPGSGQDAGIVSNTGSSIITIGGTGSGDGNIISGNTSWGYTDSFTHDNLYFYGNIIGPQKDGMSYVAGNQQVYGIFMGGGTTTNVFIGGTASGMRNIISANEQTGVFINDSTTMYGNYVGIGSDGQSLITGSSQDYGIRASLSNAYLPIIGGTGAGERNVISGNDTYGIYFHGGIFGAKPANAGVIGNIIGPQKDGKTLVTNNTQDVGIYLHCSRMPVIKNIISANEQAGIIIEDFGLTLNKIKGNYIGVNINGDSIVAGSSQDYGIKIGNNANQHIIGGTASGDGNVISGNTVHGIWLNNTEEDTIWGNIIGIGASGISAVANSTQQSGIYIDGITQRVDIGSTISGSRNIISANDNYGIYLSGSATSGNTIRGNYIGSNRVLANVAGSSQDYGVYINSSSHTNRIGGYNSGEANTIAFNTNDGVYINGASAHYNLISRNPIYNTTSTMNKAINLNASGNDNYPSPTISGAFVKTICGTHGNNGDSIEVFKSDNGCINALEYIGTTIVSGGSWTMMVNLAVGDRIIANARNNSNNNTSEFSNCVTVADLLATPNSSICKGDTMVLSAAGSSSYSWSPSAGLSATTGNIVNASPTGTTTYIVSEPACGLSDTMTLTVNLRPTVLASNDTFVCSGSNITITASGGVSYLWNNGATTSSLSLMPSTGAIYTVTVSDGNCTDTASVFVGVNTIPTLTITGNASICMGDSVTLSASGAMNYLWSGGATTSAITITPATTYTFVVTGYDSSACPDTAQKVVVVNQYPILTVSNDTAICEGQSLTLTAGGGTTYSWNNGVTTSSFSATPTINTTYSVVATNGNCTKADSVHIVVSAVPVADAGSSATIISGNSITLSGSGGGTYQWSPSAGLSCATCHNPIATPTGTTTYYLIATNAAGCTSLDSITITVEIICGDIFIPNVFSPNDDGQNDVFKIYGNCIKDIYISIYNQWGERIFAGSGLTTYWDGTDNGKKLGTDTYVYNIEIIADNGESSDKVGNVTLLR